jgi:hypothetical protein
MNWWLAPVIIVLIIVVSIINHKAKRYILMEMVKNNILNQISRSDEIIIQGYNLFYAFIVIPILLMAFALMTGTSYNYNILFSVIVFTSSFMML